MSEGSGWADAPVFCRCAKTIENISRIKMVVARASGTVMASSLKQNKFGMKLLSKKDVILTKKNLQRRSEFGLGSALER